MTNVITSIEPLSSDPNFRVIFVDGEKILTLPSHVVDHLNIKVDAPWTEALATSAASFEDESEARTMALQLIAMKAWGEKELAARLVKRGIQSAVATKVTEALQEDGWLDDLAYATARVREWTRNEPAGQRWLTMKLRERLLSEDTISEAISNELGDRSEQAAANELAKIRLQSVEGHDEVTIRRRIIAALGRRGFSSDIAAEAIRHAKLDDSQMVE